MGFRCIAYLLEFSNKLGGTAGIYGEGWWEIYVYIKVFFFFGVDGVSQSFLQLTVVFGIVHPDWPQTTNIRIFLARYGCDKMAALIVPSAHYRPFGNLIVRKIALVVVLNFSSPLFFFFFCFAGIVRYFKIFNGFRRPRVGECSLTRDWSCLFY